MIADDLGNMTAAWGKPRWWIVTRGVLLSPMYPAVRAVLWTRAGMWFWRRRAKPLAHWCKARAIRASGVEIHPAAEIGPGFAINHGVGVVIGHAAKLGSNVLIHHGVTIGHGGDAAAGQPTIGDLVVIGAGAAVLGGIHVGDRARIGANSVVLADVPAGTTVVGLWK